MRSVLAILLVTLVAPDCRAGSTVQKEAYARELYSRFVKQARTVTIDCAGDGSGDCRLDWVEKPGAPLTFEDKRSAGSTELTSLKMLSEKWKKGTISAAEKDDLLKRFIAYFLNRPDAQ